MSNSVEIAIFPIPNCVTFPGVVFPLHVFEPRYRAMIKHCLEHQMLLGICHTEKLVSLGKADHDLDEALQSNQATYKPYDVFSAGYCELLQTLDDGRIYLKVKIKQRYRSIKEVQTLPFSIHQCEPFLDIKLGDDELIVLKLTQEKILKRLQAMASRMPEALEWLSSEEWESKDPLDFSFEIFGLLQFDAELQQKILEMNDPQQRLQLLLELLNTNY